MSSYIATSNNSFKEIANTVKVQQLENTEEPKIKLNAHFGLTAPKDKTTFKYWIQCNEPENVVVAPTVISNNSNLDYSKLYLQYNSSTTYNLINQNGFNLNASLYQGWLGNIENKANKVDIWYPDLTKVSNKQYNCTASSSSTNNINTLTFTHTCNIGDRLILVINVRGDTPDFEYTVDTGWTVLKDVLYNQAETLYTRHQRTIILTKFSQNTVESITVTQPRADYLYAICISLKSDITFEIGSETFGYYNNVSAQKPDGIVLWAVSCIWSSTANNYFISAENLPILIDDKPTLQRLALIYDPTTNLTSNFKGSTSVDSNSEYIVCAIPIRITSNHILGEYGAWINTYNSITYEGE